MAKESCAALDLSSVATPARAAGDTPSEEALKVVCGLRSKRYDLTDELAAAEELKADFDCVRQILAADLLKVEHMDALVATIEAMRKWMQKVDEADLSEQTSELRRFKQLAESWKNNSSGSPDESPSLFPLLTKVGQSVNSLVRCVDHLRQLYGKDLDGMGIHLPMIVAVGQESSGKSSVMEMIAGQPFFPRHEGTCTRLPFRLQFRCSSENSVSFQDIPDGKCHSPEEVQHRIAEITKSRTGNKSISAEEVILNIRMPDVPELTMVDLPGLIGTAYKTEGTNVKQQVLDMVKKYVSQPHAIVLAVAEARTRPRDNEVFGLVKELGAEDRTIGLLTKCDQAKEKRWRLGDKIGNGLNSATPEEQEKAGFVPLKRGFYGMICRDTEEVLYAEEGQTMEAILRVKEREREAFDKLIPDSDTRRRCGSDNVYKALSALFTEYIQNTWRPETMRKLGEHIKKTKDELLALRFSERYEEPPARNTSSTEKYKQELEDRIWKLSEYYHEFVSSFQLRERLFSKLPKVNGIQTNPFLCGASGGVSSGGFSPGIGMHKLFADELMRAMDSLKDEVQRCMVASLQRHSSTRNLLTLRDFVLKCIMEKVTTWVNLGKATLAGLAELESVQLLPKPSRQRIDVSEKLRTVMLDVAEQDDCSMCLESMHSGRPIQMLLCCSKHFHAHCLDRLNNPKACPLCRAPIMDPPPRVSEQEEEQAVKQRLTELAKKVVTSVLQNLSGLKLGRELEQAVSRPGAPRQHLLEEDPEVRKKRQTLQQQLSVLRQVEQDVNDWCEM